MEPQPTAFVKLAPADLAALLDLPEADAVVLAKAPVRLPAAWVESWKTRTGPLMLTPSDVRAVTGLHLGTIYRAIKPDAVPCLRSVCLGISKNPNPRIAPADLVNFLRAVNAVHGITPTASETPTQRQRRGAKDREAALRACDGE